MGQTIFNPNLTYGFISDIDGNIYKTIQIGTQIWMAENLRTTKFKDGTTIPLILDNTMWGNLTSSGYCWYNNDVTTYKNTYGGLYNYYTVTTGNLCPMGWHIPTDNDWHTLALHLDASATLTSSESYIAGGKLKETGTTHWLSSYTTTNESGFTALPCGWRNYQGYFSGVGSNGYWWSSTNSFTGGISRRITQAYPNFYRDGYNSKVGLSIRCVRD